LLRFYALRADLAHAAEAQAVHKNDLRYGMADYENAGYLGRMETMKCSEFLGRYVSRITVKAPFLGCRPLPQVVEKAGYRISQHLE
jgi:hypothetical protein